MTDDQVTPEASDDMALLLAYADGMLDEAQRAQVERRLAGDTDARALVEQFRASALPFKAAYDDLTPAPPASLTVRKTATAGPQAWAVAAGVVLALGLGFGAGRFGVTPAGPQSDSTQVAGWVQQVMDYQALYARETVAGPSPTMTARDELTARLGQWLGHQLAIPDLSAKQLAFKRGQSLTLGDRPLVQLVYLGPEGSPVALCITTATGAAEDDNYRAGDAGDMRYAQWRREGLDYLLVGSQALAEIESAANAARTQL